MSIFSDQVFHVESVDFSRWPTINGDSIVLKDARNEYLEKCLETLNYYMNHYSSHINYPVWEEYANVIEDILVKKELSI